MTADKEGVRVEIVAPFVEPAQAEIENAIETVLKVLLDLKMQRDGMIHVRASELAEMVSVAGHNIAASHWAICNLIRRGELSFNLLRWGPVETRWTAGLSATSQSKEIPFNYSEAARLS